MTTPPQHCEPEAGRHYLNDPNGCVCGQLRLHYGSVDVDRLRALVVTLSNRIVMYRSATFVAGKIVADDCETWKHALEACLPPQEPT